MKYNNCNHDWKAVGYYNAGWGISADCKVLWCEVCGAIHKNKTVSPKVNKRVKLNT